jgi:renalase
MTTVIIIGAGIAGLACARRLVQSGIKPILLDKGRGVGGRVATRRTEKAQFDHGAQYLTAQSAEFADLLRALVESGAVAQWLDGSGLRHMVGIPGMSALPKALAAGLDIRQNVAVAAVKREVRGWLLQAGDMNYFADRLILTTPPAQAATLLGSEHPLAASLASIRMEACLTIMASIAAPAPFVSRMALDEALALIVHDSSKPGRPTGETVTWVAQASAAFSAEHLEKSPKVASEILLPLLCQQLRVGLDTVMFAQTHRWRFARVQQPLGQPFLRDVDAKLHVGGDWCLGQRVEDAWTSGIAMADDLLAQL